MDKELQSTNELAWNQDTYDAWINRFGAPEELAQKIVKDPTVKLKPLMELFGDVNGKRIVNLMGSNGVKAVALALLGAEVKVIDFSPANKRYAEELAAAAGVKIEYIMSDVLELDQSILNSSNDIVFAELGIIHYFTDLHPFFRVANKLLKPGGSFILRDFHPVSTKLLTSRGTTANVRKHKVTGDYFDASLQEVEVSYSKYLSDERSNQPAKAYIRKWNLGEIVTAVADEAMLIKLLREEPNLSSEVYDKGIPKTFSLVAEKLPRDGSCR